MDTDIIGGVQDDMDSILVLTGVTKSEQIERYSYIPTYVYNSVAEIEVNLTITPYLLDFGPMQGKSKP